jgi:catechol 2,3-dioxygenase-like lactoylglutathione lyase family enzyme
MRNEGAAPMAMAILPFSLRTALMLATSADARQHLGKIAVTTMPGGCGMSVVGFDHVAIPVERVAAMKDFYRALGFTINDTTASRSRPVPLFSVQFGENKINMHEPALWQDAAFTLRGPTARPGCGDFCFVWSGSVEQISQLLDSVAAPIEIGPVRRVGGRDAGFAVGVSVYTRDPDDNLLEFIVYGPAA